MKRAVAAPPIGLGETVRLTRQVQTDGAWETETIVGSFVGNILDAWILNVDGKPYMFPEDSWQRVEARVPSEA